MTYQMIPPQGNGTLFVMILIIALLFILLLILLLLFLSARSYTLKVDEDLLSIRSLFYNTEIAINELDIEGLRLVSYADLKIKIRSNGMALPGLLIGWFTSDGGRMKLYVTDKEKVLLIPTQKGYSIAFSTDRGEEIIAVLRGR